MNTQVIFIVGPTAAGKTQVAIELAKKFRTEIISCDSMQVYRDINILSSKPLASKIKHHLIDVVDSDREYDAARYAQEASAAIEDIIKRGKIPLVVGGTGLYMTVLLDGIFEDNQKNPMLRKNLFEEAGQFGSSFLHDKLKSLDENAAAKIHVNDTKRIVRALEVCLMHKAKFSQIRQKREGISAKYQIKIFGLNMKRGLLYERIDQRVDRMFAQGAVEEVRKLSPGNLSKTALSCLGIKQIQGYLAGDYAKEKAVELLKRDSRRYAKRQLTWFRRDRRINWIDVSGLNTGQVVEIINRQII